MGGAPTYLLSPHQPLLFSPQPPPPLWVSNHSGMCHFCLVTQARRRSGLQQKFRFWATMVLPVSASKESEVGAYRANLAYVLMYYSTSKHMPASGVCFYVPQHTIAPESIWSSSLMTCQSPGQGSRRGQ